MWSHLQWCVSHSQWYCGSLTAVSWLAVDHDNWCHTARHVAVKYSEINRAYTVSASSLPTSFEMLSTVDWTDTLSSEFQTENYTSDVTTTSPEWTSMTSNSMTPYNAALAFIGYLGTVTNGLVLVGFWLSDQSNLNTSSILIANHTTLEQSTFRGIVLWSPLSRPSLLLSWVSFCSLKLVLHCHFLDVHVTCSYGPWALCLRHDRR